MLFFSDEEQEDAEKSRCSQTQPCCSNASINSFSEGSVTTDSHPDLNHTQSSLDCSDYDTQNHIEPVCSADSHSADRADDASLCGISPESNPELSVEQSRQTVDTREEQKEAEQAEECSPSPQLNKQPASRSTCGKGKKSLFTIQAVNNSGTTEREMEEEGSALPFSCKSTHTHTHTLVFTIYAEDCGFCVQLRIMWPSTGTLK